MTPFITLPIDLVGQLSANVGQVATDVMPLIILGIGLPLGFWFVKKAMSLIKAR